MNSLNRGTIELGVARLDPQNSQTPGKSVPWKVNQVLQGTVVNRSPGELLLKIEGGTYRIQSNTPVDPGKPLMFRVASLLPQVELIFMDALGNKPRAEPNPAAILSAQLLQKTQQARKKEISNLLYFMKLFGFSDMQSLPNETLSLLRSLKKKLIKPEELSNASKLKPALRQSGLLLESKLASLENRHQGLTADINADLKAILLQIFKSLNGKPASPNQVTSRANPQAGYGLALYEANGQKTTDIKMQLIQRLEEVLGRIVAQQKNTLDESNEDSQRWFFELPVNFRSQLLTIPVSIYRDTASSKAHLGETVWGAEFSLELKNSGRINAQIDISNMSVSIRLRSELNKTARFLNEQRDSLHESLRNWGITLSDFESTQINSGLI